MCQSAARQLDEKVSGANAAVAVERESLIAFTQATHAGYIAEGMHEQIASHLEGIANGRIRRLLIVAPPQHGKSELASVRFPAWLLGIKPKSKIAITSYAATLAESKSGDVQECLRTEAYGRIFPSVRLRQRRNASSYWRTTAGGIVWAGGVGGPITGHGFDVAIIDDPFENWAQAQSETVRAHVWAWYRATLRPRILSGGSIVIIMTRWHQSDLVGHLLAEQASEWTLLRLPAVAETQEERDSLARIFYQPVGQSDPVGREPGEPLAPSRFTKADLIELQRDVQSLAWFAQYQGTPQAPGGNLIKQEWFRIQAERPRRAERRLRYWDKAASKDGKRTAGVLVSEYDGVFYIEHVIKGKWTTFERRSVMLSTAQTDGYATRIGIEQEPGSSGVDSIAEEKRMLAGWAVKADVPSGDKDTRMDAFVTQLEAGNVVLIEGPWNREYIDELVLIPHSVYRDQADATSGAFNMLARKQLVAGTW